MNNMEIPYFEEEDSKLKPDLPIIERDSINAVVYNPKTNEVLCLYWEKFGWKTFVIGGIENNEEAVVAAEREILEETGYKNIKFISIIGKTKSGYYAAHKGENRISNSTGILFELLDTERVEVKESETTHHIFKWIPKDDVKDFINISSQKYIWGKALEILN